MSPISLGKLEIQIIKKLTEESNFSSIARSLGVSKETIRRKIRAIEGSLGRLSLRVDLYALGLSYIISLNKSRINQPAEIALLDKLISSLYIRSVFSTYRINNKYNVIAMTPPLKALDGYAMHLKALSGRKSDLYVTYPPIYWTPNLTYIKNFMDPFLYDWSELCKDIEKAPAILEINLKAELKRNRDAIDYIDLFILNQLEKDPLTSIRSIARKMGISQQLAHYHYKNHVMPVILSRNLRIFLERGESVKGLLLVEFYRDSYLNKFTNVFASLPHCLAMLPDIFKPEVILIYQVYANQYTDFVKAMFELKEIGIVKRIKDYGLLVKAIFTRKVLPWKYVLTPDGWVIEKFVKEALERKKLGCSLSKEIEVRLWERR